MPGKETPPTDHHTALAWIIIIGAMLLGTIMNAGH